MQVCQIKPEIIAKLARLLRVHGFIGAYNLVLMANSKLNIYSASGTLIGYFTNADVKIDCFGESEYELTGGFFDAIGQTPLKIDFNPEALPYTADLSEISGLRHRRLRSVYVQRGRQPIKLTGFGEN